MSTIPLFVIMGFVLILLVMLWIDNQHDKKQAKKN